MNLGVPACSSSVSLAGENGQCAVTCKSGYLSDETPLGTFTCYLGQLTGPGLTCKAITCDTTGLQTGDQFNSKRADEFQGVKILTFEQKVSFACKEGYEIADKANFDPSSDDHICDRHWESSYTPQHNSKCKA